MSLWRISLQIIKRYSGCPLALTLFIASKAYLLRMLEVFNYYFSLADENKGHLLLVNSYMLRSEGAIAAIFF